MQATERLVLLIYCPGLPIELDFYHILSVSTVIKLVLHHTRRANRHLQRYLEENAPLTCTILRALLHMIDKSLSWEENAAKFALHRNRVLEHALIDLDCGDFLSQLSIAVFNVRDRVAQLLVCPHYLFTLFSLLYVCVILSHHFFLLMARFDTCLLGLHRNSIHQLFLHLSNTLLLSLLT